MSTLSPLEILDKVDRFYSNAWGQLVLFVTILIALFGIAAPVLLSFYQRQLARAKEERLRDHIEKAVADARARLKEEMEAAFEAKRKVLESDFRKAAARIDAKAQRSFGATLHLQGTGYLDEKRYAQAAESLLEAAYFYLRAQDYRNLLRVLKNLESDILPTLTKDDFANFRLEERFARLTEALQMLNEKDLFADHIDTLITALPKALKREKKVNEQRAQQGARANDDSCHGSC